MTWTCRECTAAYAVGLPACPQCGSTEREETGMSKITVAAGLTHPDTDLTEQSDDKGGEQPSPGTSSSTSSEKPSTKPEPNEQPRPQRARATANRSKKAQTGGSSAGSTDGGQTAASAADKK